MAIDYTTLFTRIGKLVKTINSYLTLQATVMASAAEVIGEYNTRLDLVPTLQQQFAGWASQPQSWEQALKQACDATLADLQATLITPSASVTVILPLLYADMVANTMTLTPCTVGTSTSVGGSNVGSGKLVVLATDQRLVADVVNVTCVTDQYGGRAAGAESFSLTGGPAASAYSGLLPQGTGSGASMTVLDGANMVFNGNFEAFTSSVPNGWTIDVGAGLVSNETSLVHCGTSALKLSGDGTSATCTLHQALSAVRAYTPYVMGVWLRKSGTVTSGSNLQVCLTGTSFTPINLFNADPSSLTTSYVFYSVQVSAQSVVPSDVNVKITWTSANIAGAAAVVLMDDLVLGSPTSFGNAYYALFCGAADFVVGDTFQVTNTNDHAGVFQAFFSRFYNFALPTSGSPTISDSLAT